MLILDRLALLSLLVERQQSPVNLARRIGVSASTIARLLERDRPVRIATLGKIAAALDVDYKKLLKESSDETQ